MRGFARVIALAAALIAWLALGLQLALIIQTMAAQGATAGQAVWRFFGFFTILTNFGVAAVASAMALWPGSMLAGPRVRLAAAVAIVIVGIVYAVALRSVWEPTGWQAVADHALHDVTPPLFLLAWLVADHGRLQWRSAGWGVVAPVCYCVYALVRGGFDGWYAYWFLDPGKLSLGQMALNIAILLAAFVLVALCLVGVDKLLARARS